MHTTPRGVATVRLSHRWLVTGLTSVSVVLWHGHCGIPKVPDITPLLTRMDRS